MTVGDPKVGFAAGEGSPLTRGLTRGDIAPPLTAFVNTNALLGAEPEDCAIFDGSDAKVEDKTPSPRALSPARGLLARGLAVISLSVTNSQESVWRGTTEKARAE